MRISSIILAALLGTMTYSDVQAVQLANMKKHHKQNLI